MFSDNNSVVIRTESLLATHTVLRNTYMLLSLTLFFSAAMAGWAMHVHAAPLSPWIVLLGSMGLLFLTTALRNSGLGLVSVFAFTGFFGWTLGPCLNAYMAAFQNGPQLVTAAIGCTAVIFLSLSGYVIVTKKDFSYMGGFLFVALIVAALCSMAGMLFHLPAFYLVTCAATVLIASGLILFDTSRIINNGERNYIMATISLYLDIYMLFVNLLQIFGALSGNNRN
jgi:modulator of FtsH protease